VGVIVSTADGADTELAEGYKPSDVGVIPQDWDVVPLAGVLDFRNGVNADKSAYGRGIRFINVLEVITTSHLTARDVPGRVTLPASAVASCAVRRGDIVFNRTSETQDEVGLAAVYLDEEPVVFGGFVIRGRLITSSFDPVYFGYGLRAPAVRRQIAMRGQGAIRANIGQADLRQVLVPVPPITEQRMIAATLRKADQLVEALDQEIEKKQEMKSAAMRRLLTGESRLSNFDGEWEVKRLGDILTFLPTASNPRADLSDDGDTGYLHYGDIHAHTSPQLDCSATPLPRIDRSKVTTRALMADGDLVIVDASEDLAGVGKSVEIKNLREQPAVAGLHTILCRGDCQHWAPGFKSYVQFMPAFKQALQRVATGTSVYGISKRHLAEIELTFPSVAEQEAITSVLSDIHNEIGALTRRRSKMHFVRKGMQVELLTGRTRLHAAVGA
jgi:type I restriction enzyme S subunit